MAWASACIARAKPEDAILVNEYTLMPEHCGSNLPGSYFGSSPASGLGWGGGAALGAKLAAPDRLVIATLGDGSYLFGNPVALHHAAAAHDLPVLFVVMNNSMWGAVRRATSAMYPQGEAMRSNKPPLIDLDELPAFEQVCAAAGRLWRAGRGPGSPAGCARTRAPCGHDRQASGASQRHLPRAMSPSSPVQSVVGHGAICQARHCAG